MRSSVFLSCCALVHLVVATQDVSTRHYVELRSHSRHGGAKLPRRSTQSRMGVASAVNDPFALNWWVDAEFGNQSVELMIDTGSTDLWVLHEGFTCSNGTDIVPKAQCYAGPVFHGTFPEGAIPNENFNTTYASGEALIGTVGYAPFTVAGLVVPKQEFGLIDYAFWPAGAGILGLAYPSLVYGAWNGSNPKLDNTPGHGREPYTPPFQHLVQEGQIESTFSIALPSGPGADFEDRKGYIAFGGLPPVAVDGPWTSAEMYITPPYNKKAYTEYTVNTTSMTFPSYTGNTTELGGLTILDTGTISVNAPNDVVAAYSKLFDPPAIYPKDLGLWITKCDAKAPKEPLIVQINGTSFEIPGKNLLLDKALLDENGIPSQKYGNWCFSGLQNGVVFGEGTLGLGRPFLETLVVVFDVAGHEVRLGKRK